MLLFPMRSAELGKAKSKLNEYLEKYPDDETAKKKWNFWKQDNQL